MRQKMLDGLKSLREKLGDNVNSVAGHTGKKEERKSYTVGFVLDELAKLGDVYKTMSEFSEKSGIGIQNKTYLGIRTLLENEGVKLSEVTTRNSGASRLSGTAAVLDMLKANGLSLPTSESKDN